MKTTYRLNPLRRQGQGGRSNRAVMPLPILILSCVIGWSAPNAAQETSTAGSVTPLFDSTLPLSVDKTKAPDERAATARRPVADPRKTQAQFTPVLVLSFDDQIAFHNMSITSDGVNYYTINGGNASAGQINKYDLAGLFVSSTPINLDARAILYNPADSKFYVKTFERDWHEVNPNTGTFVQRLTDPFAFTQSSPTLTFDGSAIFEHESGVARRLDATTGTLLGTLTGFSFGAFPSNEAITTDNTNLFTWDGVAQQVFAYTMTGGFIEDFFLPSGNYGFSLSYANGLLWVSEDGGGGTGTWYGYRLEGGTGPDITVAPTSFSFTVPVNGTASGTLTLGNVGDAILNWNITEQEATRVQIRARELPARWQGGPGSLAAAGSQITAPAAANTGGPGHFRNGVWMPGEAPAQDLPESVYIPPTAVETINFDDQTRPCAFAEITALREDYAARGVHFSGPAANDGGGLLNQCGGFGVTGHSAPNFLAFNSGARFSNGGVPRPPETVTFDSPVSSVEAKVGSNSSSGSTLTMRAFNASGVLLGTASVTLATSLRVISIAAAGISSVEFSTSATVFVLDDLSWNTGAADCPWLTESPTSGTIMPGGSQTVAITANAAGLAPGVYNCEMLINSNDPDEDPFVVPVRLTVTPPDGLDEIAVVANRTDRTLHVIDVANNFIAGPFLAGSLGTTGDLLDVAVTPDGQTALVSNFQLQTLFFVDVSNPLAPSLLGSAGLPFFAEDIAITPDGAYALVTDGANNMQITSVNISSRSIANTLNIGPRQALSVAVAADGQTVLVGDFLNNRVHVLRLNPATGVLTDPALAVTVGSGPINITISPDGQTALVANFNGTSVSVLRITSPGQVAASGTVTNIAQPQSIEFKPDGTRAYVVEVGGSPDRLAVLAVTAPGTVTDTGLRANLISNSVGTAFLGVDVLAVSSDGSHAYVGNPGIGGTGFTTEVAVVDLSVPVLQARLTAGTHPVGVAVGRSAGGECTLCGDVNEDGLVNSTDALIILSCELGVSCPPDFKKECGDVNLDNATNSTDALIILTCDVGLPQCPPNVGKPGGCR